MKKQNEILLPTAPGLPDCRVVVAARSTIGLQITRTGEIVLRVPPAVPLSRIRTFLTEKTPWLVKRYARIAEAPRAVPFSVQELAEMKAMAGPLVQQRVEKYAPMVGVTWNRVTVRAQKTRWGSCSTEGNLNFNCLLVKVPLEVLDSVVVHELCHRRVMGHGDDFYTLLYRVFPAYDTCRDWLNKNGSALIARLP